MALPNEMSVRKVTLERNVGPSDLERRLFGESQRPFSAVSSDLLPPVAELQVSESLFGTYITTNY